MLRPGTRVQRLSTRNRDRGKIGVITAVKGRSYEIRWSDGKTTITHPVGISALKRKRP